MIGRLEFFINRIREILWVRPLAFCLLSVTGALLAKTADYTDASNWVPEITRDTLETLLKILSSSMLVIATFAVGSMVSSYASAGRSATPRSFPLVISDDVSQNALSSFIGAFIFGIVTLIALINGFYGAAGRFALFCLTLLTFAVVILTFVRWVDSIARLGRLGPVIDKVERVTACAFKQRCRTPTLGGVRAGPVPADSVPVYGESVGYVQRLDTRKLQNYAEEADFRISIDALPGTFATPDRPLAHIIAMPEDSSAINFSRIAGTFEINGDRTFDEDPRFGLVVLSEIAGRALSPAVNDPGTAIDIIGTFVRLFVLWHQASEEEQPDSCKFDRVEVPEISVRDLFDDAFTAVARDGAGTVEVAIQLQKALRTLGSTGNAAMRDAAEHHARIALARAEHALTLPQDLEAVRSASLMLAPTPGHA